LSVRRPTPRRESPDGSPRFISRGIRIVHEDDQLLVIEKPTGIITADPAAASGRPAAKAGSTLFDIVKTYIKEQPDRRPTKIRGGDRTRTIGARVWIIHRLDKEASGLLVFAKTEQSFAWLKDDLRAKRIDRVYSAVAEGIVGKVGESGTLQSFLREEAPRGPRGSRRGRGDTDEDQGKLAITHYKVIAVGSGRTLLEVKLDTGRKNQIRVQFGEKGFPLVGDRRFGAKTDAIGRLGLHAAELTITPPNTGQPVTYRSPIPPSFFRCVGFDGGAAETGELAASGSRVAAPPLPAPVTNGSKASAPAKPIITTAWENVAGWYDELLEDRGNDHYDDVVLPGALRLLEPRAGMRVLDVACGQGILCRRMASLGVESVGIEASPKLVAAARERSSNPPRNAAPVRYEVGDARELNKLDLTGFDAAMCVMALSNIDPLDPVMAGVARALKPSGTFVWIITHPAFRAIGQTFWGWDAAEKKQYRRVDGYLSTGRQKIEMNPGKVAKGGESLTTWSFHRPLQAYIESMAKAGLAVQHLEEWPSLRASTSGPRAAEENRSRREIPLFIGVRAVKLATDTR